MVNFVVFSFLFHHLIKAVPSHKMSIYFNFSKNKTHPVPTNRPPCYVPWIVWFRVPNTRVYHTKSMFDLLAFWQSQSLWSSNGHHDWWANSPVSSRDRQFVKNANSPGPNRFQPHKNLLKWMSDIKNYFIWKLPI